MLLQVKVESRSAVRCAELGEANFGADSDLGSGLMAWRILRPMLRLSLLFSGQDCATELE